MWHRNTRILFGPSVSTQPYTEIPPPHADGCGRLRRRGRFLRKTRPRTVVPRACRNPLRRDSLRRQLSFQSLKLGKPCQSRHTVAGPTPATPIHRISFAVFFAFSSDFFDGFFAPDRPGRNIARPAGPRRRGRRGSSTHCRGVILTWIRWGRASDLFAGKEIGRH